MCLIWIANENDEKSKIKSECERKASARVRERDKWRVEQHIWWINTSLDRIKRKEQTNQQQ